VSSSRRSSVPFPFGQGVRLGAWGDRQRWPFNYLVPLGLLLFIALMAFVAAMAVAPHQATWWAWGAVAGGFAAVVEASWRLRVRGSLWMLDVDKVRVQQQKNIASLSRPYMQLVVGLAIVVPAVVGGSPVASALFSFFGGYLIMACAIRVVSAYRHRANLKAFTDRLHAPRARPRG